MLFSRKRTRARYQHLPGCLSTFLGSRCTNMLRYPCSWLGGVAAAVAAAATCFPAQQGYAFKPCPVPCDRQPLPGDRRHVMMPQSCASPSSGSSSSVVSVSTTRAEGWKKAVLPFLPPDRCRSSSPAESLRRGEWFKLICGASFEVLWRDCQKVNCCVPRTCMYP